MTLKKTLSFVLTLALVLSVLAPCGILQASAEQAPVYYGSEKLVQVTAPVIGGSYYMGADVNGTMYYFVWEGKVTDTAPYSLHATDDFSNTNVKKVTLAAPAEDQSGFQITFADGANTRTIYSYDALTSGENKDVVDTGAHSPAVSAQYHYKHNFSVQEYNGQHVLRKAHFDTVLAVKYFDSVSAWRMLCVEKAELENEGVYPVMLLTEHEHSFGNAVVDTTKKTATRTCVICGYEEVVYSSKLIKAEEYTVGGNYYLAADVEGTMRYFSISGSVSATAPYSFPTTEDASATKQVTLEDPNVALESKGDGFQIAYDNNGTVTRIYCMDVLKDTEEVPGQTGIMDTGANSSTPYRGRHTFECVEIDGVKVLRKLSNNNILVVKYFDSVSAWRMLGVPEAELANEGVYPVILMEEHTHNVTGGTYMGSDAGHQRSCWCGGYGEISAHTYGALATNDNVATRVCSVCGYSQVVMDQKLQQVKTPEIGGTYYLSANVDGTLKYFCTPPSGGSVTNTSPYSLYTTESAANCAQVTLEDSVKTSEKHEGGFQLTFDNGGTLARIYCYDVLTTTGNKGIMDTGTNTANYVNRHTFIMDEVNGVTVLRKYGNNNILVVKYNETRGEWRMLGVPESELSNEGVYPVTLSVAHEHNYSQWIANENGTNSNVCEACGHEAVYYGTDTKVTQVDAPVIGESYYLVANADGKLIFFRHGVATDTAPYSLVATDNANHNWVLPVTIEDPTLANEGTSVGFQMTYTNPSTDALARIYCYDVLKDTEEVPGQTGVMDTGINSANYKGRHTFQIADVNGMKVLKKLSNNNILVAKYNETKGEWRMLGVPEAELANEGVYPVMLANRHVHTFSEAYYGGEEGHWHLCDCGSKSQVEDHVVDSWNIVTHPTATESGSKTGTCTVCGVTVTVETPVIVESWNIVPGDDIGVNFVLALTEGDQVQVKVDGEEVPVTLNDNGDGTYSVLINVAAAQMTSQIAIVVNGQAVEETYSVRQYADIILADEQYTDYAKALIKNMLNYGAAAQNFFNYNVKYLANTGITVDAITVPELMALETSDNLDGIDFYGATVVMENKTAVRFYFNAQSVEGLTFQVDGNTYEPIAKDGKYYIEVAGIEPQDYADLLNLLVTDGTNELAVAYSPLHYITRMYRNGSDETKAVAQAMYGYYLAAKTYYANLNLDGTFALQSQSSKSLYEGVNQLKKTYIAAGYGEVNAYIVTVAADANVELKVSAGAWDETNNAENPAEVKTVVNHFRAVKNAGYNVLAMINGGFFDMSGKSMLPLGMQVVDGVVKQTPNADDTAHGNNWFGMTTDGKYVISDAAGYASTYTGNVKQAIGGGKLLIVDGTVQSIASERDFRTAVGINAEGDLVMVCVEDATYNDVCQIFVDMGMDIETVLNLDGGGSTAMCIPGAFYPKTLIQGDDGLFAREVADAIAIVAK